jgi:hypothetical protein
MLTADLMKQHYPHKQPPDKTRLSQWHNSAAPGQTQVLLLLTHQGGSLARCHSKAAPLQMPAWDKCCCKNPTAPSPIERNYRQYKLSQKLTPSMSFPL